MDPKRPDDLLDQRTARRWLGLALGVLVIAGVFALSLVLGRMPPFDTWVTDPQFFRRCLVVHVNLALVLWFYSFVAMLLLQLPARAAGGLLTRISVHLGWLGLLLLCIAPWIPDTQPILSNYVPMIDHWMFGLGQSFFAAGVAAVALSRRWLPSTGESSEIHAGLRASILGLAIAGFTLFSTWVNLPANLAPQQNYEVLFWGAGHVLQVVSVAAMATVWLMLARALCGRSAMGHGWSVILFALLMLPWMAAPLLPLEGTWSATYRTGFTRLMQFGMLPILAFLVVMLRVLWRSRVLRDPRAAALATSVGLTIAGLVLGAMIRDSNTVVPAHYHASIGAVTVAFMGAAYHLLKIHRSWAWQPLLFGAGQFTFALGFAMAGTTRKIYGAEQAERTLSESIGLVVMGVGGLIAVAGGVIFLLVASRTLLARQSRTQPTNLPWTIESTPSRS
jgi:cytochrome c oxidase subunit I